MIEDVIAKLERRIQDAPDAGSARHQELLDLLHELKEDIEAAAQEDEEAAESLVQFTRAAVHEATRTTPSPGQVDRAVEGVQEALTAFEVRHPRLTRLVNAVCTSLSNMGI